MALLPLERNDVPIRPGTKHGGGLISALRALLSASAGRDPSYDDNAGAALGTRSQRIPAPQDAIGDFQNRDGVQTEGRVREGTIPGSGGGAVPGGTEAPAGSNRSPIENARFGDSSAGTTPTPTPKKVSSSKVKIGYTYEPGKASGKSRWGTIAAKTKELYERAAEIANKSLPAGEKISEVRVYSGGQVAGTPGVKRFGGVGGEGSTYHDLGGAGDVHLINEKGEKFTYGVGSGTLAFDAFAGAGASLGAKGIGMNTAAKYMGPQTIHMGFGADNKPGNNLYHSISHTFKASVNDGWNNPDPDQITWTRADQALDQIKALGFKDVESFQEAYNIGVDGKIGKDTMTAAWAADTTAAGKKVASLSALTDTSPASLPSFSEAKAAREQRATALAAEGGALGKTRSAIESPFSAPGAKILKRTKKPIVDEDVRELQKRLNQHFATDLKETGVFDERTEQAVKALQETEGLNPDGAVGDQTRAVLQNAIGNATARSAVPGTKPPAPTGTPVEQVARADAPDGAIEPRGGPRPVPTSDVRVPGGSDPVQDAFDRGRANAASTERLSKQAGSYFTDAIGNENAERAPVRQPVEAVAGGDLTPGAAIEPQRQTQARLRPPTPATPPSAYQDDIKNRAGIAKLQADRSATRLAEGAPLPDASFPEPGPARPAKARRDAVADADLPAGNGTTLDMRRPPKPGGTWEVAGQDLTPSGAIEPPGRTSTAMRSSPAPIPRPRPKPSPMSAFDRVVTTPARALTPRTTLATVRPRANPTKPSPMAAFDRVKTTPSKPLTPRTTLATVRPRASPVAPRVAATAMVRPRPNPALRQPTQAEAFATRDRDAFNAPAPPKPTGLISGTGKVDPMSMLKPKPRPPAPTPASVAAKKSAALGGGLVKRATSGGSSAAKPSSSGSGGFSGTVRNQRTGGWDTYSKGKLTKST